MRPNRKSRLLPGRLLLSALLPLFLGTPALGQQGDAPLSNTQGEVVNYETPLIKPLLVTADGRFLLALNEADDRLVVRDAATRAIVAEVVVGQGAVAMAERPGAREVWVSAMHSSAVVVVDTASWRVTHTLRPPIPDSFSLEDGAAPGGIAFSQDGSKAWVVATATDALLVYDGATKKYLKTVPLAVEHNGHLSRPKEPRAIVREGNTLYVTIFRSGNGTAAVPHSQGGVSPGIVDLAQLPGLSLPDADVLALSALDGSVTFFQRGVGTLNYGLAVHPLTGRLLVTHMDALNGVYIGERSFPKGRTTLNRLTYLTPGADPADYTQVGLEDLPGANGPVSLAMPTDITVDVDGRVYVAAYASAAIGVFDAEGSFLGVLPSDLGPRGLAVSPAGDRLYCLNRIAGTITTYDISGPLPGGPLASDPIGSFDPTFDRVRRGRALYNDAANSGGGSTGCFSCHPDATQDGAAWELSPYHGPGEGYTPASPPPFWRDRKFARTTQDCRSLEDSAPYHWRGEQKDLEAFNGAFVNVLKGKRLSDPDFALLKEFVFSAVYPTNPHQRLDRRLNPLAKEGLAFVTEHCIQCHVPPIATRGVVPAVIVEGRTEILSGDLVAAEPGQWRGFWTRDADFANIAEQGAPITASVTGFGFDHSGSQANLLEFAFRAGHRNGGPPHFTLQERIRLFNYLREFDSGLAPMSNFAGMLNQETLPEFPMLLLVDQAALGNCDVAGHGRLRVDGQWVDVGLFYDRSRGVFVSDRSTFGTFTPLQLNAAVARGDAELLMLGVPLWSGERIGVDHDRDGLYDGDELAAGTDPANPDTDGDGFWDSYDDHPLQPDDTVANDAAPVVTSWKLIYVNSRSARLSYETDTFSPTRVLYGKTYDYDHLVGDPVPLPARSNHWKRRHSIVLRNMEAGTTYHFLIRTRGQNGVEGGMADRTLVTLPMVLPTVPTSNETIHVAALHLDVDRVVGLTTFTATVTVETNAKERVPNAQVNGVWTLFRGGEPFTQLDADRATTDGDGIATVTFSSDLLLPGDEVDFTVPMFRGPYYAAEAPGVLDANVATRRPFAWPDNVVTSVKTAVP